MAALLVIVPAVAGLLALGIRDPRVAGGTLVGVAGLHLVGSGTLWAEIAAAGIGPLFGFDAAGRLVLSITSLLFLLAALYAVPYLRGDAGGHRFAPHRFVPCMLWFLAAMTLAAESRHLGIMWAAVEGTTLASAPLVYSYRRRAALEAAWKYLLLCSVGIALALLGTFCLGIAASGTAAVSLTPEGLAGVAPQMARPWLKVAFVLALVGYGTKMGLVPLHTWLPDTHSQAPSPVSALLSGALLNCAFLAVLRFFEVAVASGEAEFARSLLRVLGLATVGVASGCLLRQRDYKRLLAYSSVENMGLVALGAGVGGPAVFGALLHVLNHSLCKAGLFFCSGNVLRAYGTTVARQVHGVARRLPVTGALMTVLLLAIGGAPPFGPFWSKVLIVQAAIGSSRPWVGVILLGLLAAGFLGMVGRLLPMVWSGSETGHPRAPEGWAAVGPAAAAAGTVLAIGLYLPPVLATAIRTAASALGG